jgi:opacity protein-like surface antigen
MSALLVLVSVPGRAQEAPKVEVFGGYSFLRPEGGGNLNGWQVSVAGNINDWFGVVAELSGHYGSRHSRSISSFPGFPGLPDPPIFNARTDSESSFHTFLFGPRFSYRKNARVTPFAHALVGASRVQEELTTTISFSDMNESFNHFSFSDTNFAVALGGGIDLNLSKGFGLRLVQADYLPVRRSGFTQDNARISTGLVFRF